MARAAFSELIHGNNRPVVIDFFAEWCTPCQSLKSVLLEVKNHFGDRVRIIEIDVDRNPEVTALFALQSIPTLAMFHEGELKWIQAGVVSPDQLEQIISPYIRSVN